MPGSGPRSTRWLFALVVLALVAFPAGSAAPFPIFERDFSDGTLDAFTVLSAAWTVREGALEVQTPGNLEAWIHTTERVATRPFRVDFDVTFLSTPSGDPGKHGGVMLATHRAGRTPGHGVSPANGTGYEIDVIEHRLMRGFRIVRFDEGYHNPAAEFPRADTAVVGVPRHWTIDATESEIAFSVDGERIGSVLDSRYQGPFHIGLWAYFSQHVRFDNVVVSKEDATPPVTVATLAGEEGANGWFRSEVDVTLLATDDFSGVARTRFAIDAAPLAEGTSFTVAGDGEHVVAFASEDRAGNVEATRERPVRIDATPPSVAIRDPALDPALAGFPRVALGNVTVEASASDAASGVERVEFRVDGVHRATAHAPPFAFVWDAGREAAGEHRLVAEAFDAAGNAASDELAFLSVPTTPDGVLATPAAPPRG